jgi:hypothetical protein
LIPPASYQAITAMGLSLGGIFLIYTGGHDCLNAAPRF